MSFTERMQQRLLPATQLYMKTIESRYQEPIQQLLAIDKEIRTLRSPRNLSRASRSYGASDKGLGRWTQLLSNYEKLESKAKEARASTETEIKNRIKDRIKDYKDMIAPVHAPENIVKVTGLVNALYNNPNEEQLKLNLRLITGRVEEDPYSKSDLYALNVIRNTLKLKASRADEEVPSSAIALIDKLSADIVKTPQFHEDNTFVDADLDKFNPSVYFEDYYKNYTIKENVEDVFSKPENHPILLEGLNLSNYSSYGSEIKWVKGIINQSISGNLTPRDIPTSSSNVNLKKDFLKKLSPGLTLDDNSERIIINEDAPEDQKAIAKKILSENVDSPSPTYDEFINSPLIQEARSGAVSAGSLQKQMLNRADELEDRRNQLMQAAVDAGRLSPAQISLLTNPLYTRRGFRNVPRYGLLKRAAKFDDEPVESVTQTTVEQPPTESAESAEVPEPLPGVPVLTAIHKTVDSALEDLSDALREGDPVAIEKAKGEMNRVLIGFNSLPEDLRRQFGDIVNASLVSFEALDEQSKGLSPDELDLIRQKFVLDSDRVVAVGNVADYFANRTNDRKGTLDLYSVTDFLDENANRFGDLYESSIQRFEERTNQYVDRDLKQKASGFVLGDAAAGAFEMLGPEVDGLNPEQFGQLQTLAQNAAGMGFDVDVPYDEMTESAVAERTATPAADPLDFASEGLRSKIEKRAEEINQKAQKRKLAEASEQQDRAIQAELAGVDEQDDDADVDPIVLNRLNESNTRNTGLTAAPNATATTLLNFVLGTNIFKPLDIDTTGVGETVAKTPDPRVDMATKTGQTDRPGGAVGTTPSTYVVQVPEALDVDLGKKPEPPPTREETFRPSRVVSYDEAIKDQQTQTKVPKIAQAPKTTAKPEQPTTPRTSPANDYLERNLNSVLGAVSDGVKSGELGLQDANRYLHELALEGSYDKKVIADFQSNLNDSFLQNEMKNVPGQTTQVAGVR